MKSDQHPSRPNIKSNLHPRSGHRDRYDFSALLEAEPSLKEFITKNPRNELTIDFANPQAVLTLNQSILSSAYKIRNWSIPKNYLCPPIPGRADYVHYLADLLGETCKKKLPKGKGYRVLDIGTGASLIYPLLMNRIYGWSSKGTDIDDVSIENAQEILENNTELKSAITLQLQVDSTKMFDGIITPGDYYHATICNPPFHKSSSEAKKGSLRKIRNLSKNEASPKELKLNFGGQNSELWCEGGEYAFITKMIHESKKHRQQVGWFTSLISKQETAELLDKMLNELPDVSYKFITMSQGQKQSRFVGWTFKSKKELRLLCDLGESLY